MWTRIIEQSKRIRVVTRGLHSAGIFVVSLFAVSCQEIEPMSWESLSVSGKGVMVAKMSDGEKSNYYLVSGTNRVIPLHVVRKTGRMFTSLDSLLDFIALKPVDVMLIEATAELVREEDDGKLEVLSAQERDKIWRAREGGR